MKKMTGYLSREKATVSIINWLTGLPGKDWVRLFQW